MKLRDLILGFSAGTFLSLFGCATSIPVTVTKPAEVNMAATRKVAVIDFAVAPKSQSYKTEDLLKRALEEFLGLEKREKTLEERVSQYCTERVILTLVDTNYFQVVSPREVREVMKGKMGRVVQITQVGKATGAKAVISGEIYMMQSKDEESTTTEEVKDPDTKVVTQETHYWITRTASLGLEYVVINADTGVLIAARSFEDTKQNKKERKDKDRLAKAEEMYESIIDSFMPNIAHQLAPYKVRETRTLMKDKSKSSQLKQAARLAKSGAYEEALVIYLDVWKSKENPAAGYNGAIVYEVMGNLDAAISLMKEVIGASDKRGVVREYQRLMRVKEERRRLEEQLSSGT